MENLTGNATEKEPKAENLEVAQNDIRLIRKQRIESLYKALDSLDLEAITRDHEPACRIVGRDYVDIDRASGNPPHSIRIYFSNESSVDVWDFPELHTLFTEYQTILDQIENVHTRALGPEQQMVRRMRLEEKRQAVHNRSAQIIQERLGKSKVSITVGNARLLVEAVHNLWLLGTLVQNEYLGHDFELLDKEKVVTAVKEKYGIAIEPIRYQGGYHDEEPYFYWKINLSGPNVKAKQNEIFRYIREEIANHKKTVRA